ncbi:MAG: AAA family ATPase [Woeseiaceae bacterium]
MCRIGGPGGRPNGEGQAVCISGEPGIGKSRVLEELRAELSTQQNLYLQANCLAYRSSTPYFPLVQIVRRLLDIDRFDTQTGLAEALDRKLSDANIEDSSARDALMHFLDAADAFELEAESIPASSRDQLFDIATRLLLHASRRRPVVVAIEDLHWQDATSEQWLSSFIHRMTGARILLLLTYRPGYQATWLPSSAVTQLALPRLNDTDSAELVDSLQLDIPASTELRQQIVNHAQGIPFFLEELAFNLADRGELTGYDVPKTVQAVLAARIDQLDASDKTVLQTAAVIGMPVPRDVLEAVTALDEQTLDGCTDRLQTAELLFEADTDGGRALRFKHALTQDVAYQSLLGSARRECHRVIAACYEEQFPERAETQPELVAHHYGEAGLAERALDYWYRAGVRAAQRSANPEAVVHFEQALKASEALPESRELGERQLDIFLRMGPPLMSSKAFTSPDVEQAYLKGKTLCETLDDRDSLFTVLWGLWLHKSHRGEIEQARALSAKILELARTLDDPEKTMQAHHTGWTNEIWHGDLNACQEHAMEGNRLYDPVKHKRHKYLYGGHDPGVCARGTAGIAAWFLGYPDQALELVESGAALAIELDHPFSQVITHHDFMEIAMLMRNPDMCQEYAERAIERCEQIHVPNYLAVGHVFAGWAKFRAAGDTAGITQMRQGLEDFKSLGAVRNLAPYLLLLADVLTTAEGCAEGLAVIEEAESLIAHTGEIRWQPEVIRLRGEMLLLASSDNAPQADALFGDALELAGEHACKSFELRAALSLSRLLHSQGDAGDARNTLQPVYDWFTEGFETGDLRQARALLDSIS